jgi:N-acyl homoserine lactone hydrolase
MSKLLFIFAAALLFPFEADGGETMTLYAVKYGESAFPASQIFKDDKTGRSFPFSWMFYAIKAGKDIILIDTGFSDKNLAKSFGVKFLPYQNELAATGITEETVTAIVLTHTHFDHAGNIDLYPNASIVVNSRDKNSKAFKTTDASKITFFESSYQILPGITIHHAGGHTSGSSYVELIVNGKKFILTGDEAYLPENVLKIIPVGAFYDTAANVKFLTMARDSGAEILTFHDPSVVKKGYVRQLAP